MILDAGFLVAVDRGEALARDRVAVLAEAGRDLHTSHPVVAQVWRDGRRQARLARFLQDVTVHHFDDGSEVGRLLARSGSADVVDAHLVVLAVRLGQEILTGDPDDLEALAATAGALAPRIRAWPPRR